MAARYRKIDPRIWTDEKFRLLSGQEQRIALYILTAQTNRIGLFSFSPGKACEDLETSPTTFRKGFRKVCETLNWEWDSDARVVYLPTWWRYNQPENANNVIGNLKDLDDLPENLFLDRFSTNTIYLLDSLVETFTQTLAKRFPKGSPSLEQKQIQVQEQEQESLPADEREFLEFWRCYPMRNGKRLGKPEALKKWKSLNVEDRKGILAAVQHYASSEMVLKGIGIKDPHRWLHNGKDDEPWRDWIEPEQRTTKADVPHKKCAHQLYADTCEDYAMPESKYCSNHKATLVANQKKHGIVANYAR